MEGVAITLKRCACCGIYEEEGTVREVFISAVLQFPAVTVCLECAEKADRRLLRYHCQRFRWEGDRWRGTTTVSNASVDRWVAQIVEALGAVTDRSVVWSTIKGVRQ